MVHWELEVAASPVGTAEPLVNHPLKVPLAAGLSIVARCLGCGFEKMEGHKGMGYTRKGT